ncbi:MAG: hypothetical protein QW584_01215 [Thermofilaceae archaeon]
MGRSVSEFIALLTVITISLVAVFLFTSFFSGFLGSFTPRTQYLKVTVSSVEVLHSGSSISVSIGSTTFTASYVYRVTLVLHNAGTEPAVALQYSVRSLNPSLVRVGTNDSVDVYDPVSLAIVWGYSLPESLDRNQAASFTLVVLSKKDLTLQFYNVLVLVVRGSFPSGETQEAQVALFA